MWVRSSSEKPVNNSDGEDTDDEDHTGDDKDTTDEDSADYEEDTDDNIEYGNSKVGGSYEMANLNILGEVQERQRDQLQVESEVENDCQADQQFGSLKKRRARDEREPHLPYRTRSKRKASMEAKQRVLRPRAKRR
jgi:hypothetical protein